MMFSPHRSTGLGALGLAVLAAGLVSAQEKAEACEPSPYTASICLTAISYCPDGYYELAGGLLSIANYTQLYALIGPTFGGDGRSTFGVPDLRGRELVGTGQGPGLTPLYRGYQVGFEQEAMYTHNTPQHTHTVDLSKATQTATLSAVSGTADTTDPTRAAYARSQASKAYAATSDTTMAPDVFGSTTITPNSVTGATPQAAANPQPFGILGPQLGFRACISLDGDFPPRP